MLSLTTLAYRMLRCSADVHVLNGWAREALSSASDELQRRSCIKGRSRHLLSHPEGKLGSRQELAVLFREIDVNGDLTVDFKEFTRCRVP